MSYIAVVGCYCTPTHSIGSAVLAYNSLSVDRDKKQSLHTLLLASVGVAAHSGSCAYTEVVPEGPEYYVTLAPSCGCYVLSSPHLPLQLFDIPH